MNTDFQRSLPIPLDSAWGDLSDYAAELPEVHEFSPRIGSEMWFAITGQRIGD